MRKRIFALVLAVATIASFGGVVRANDKVTICHATHSEKNPYVVITVSVNGLNGHDHHADDVIPFDEEGCSVER